MNGALQTTFPINLITINTMSQYNLDPITELNVLVCLRLRIRDLWQKRRNGQRLFGAKNATAWSSMVKDAVRDLRTFRASRIS